ncbi:MAG TPA: hypothetical protein VF556_08415 [Pyrinomonadaceae bacterium]|jgi:hypothetical protein
MRKLNSLIAVLVICFVGLSVCGQRKEISKEMFHDSYKKAGENLGKLSYRVISEMFVYGADETQIRRYSKGTTENLSPTVWRSVSELKENEINRTTYFEKIRIGEVEYNKDKNGVWTKKTVVQPQPSPLIRNNSHIAKYFLTENARLGNEVVDLYEMESQYNNQSTEPRTGRTVQYSGRLEQKNWINKKGLTSKVELTDVDEESGKIKSRRILIYQYDPNIKIEAPIE